MIEWIIALALLVHGIGHITFFFADFIPVPVTIQADPAIGKGMKG